MGRIGNIDDGESLFAVGDISSAVVDSHAIGKTRRFELSDKRRFFRIGDVHDNELADVAFGEIGKIAVDGQPVEIAGNGR